ncbi:PIG-L family deacetylase [Candidatus Woesearchaeota archaeon]|nr:PIG-L family deacetylase [Candidatus Woesearchaeota archaeon]
MSQNILVICAHADDEILGVGGTIARYAQEGKNVYVVIFSYGEGSHFWMKKKWTVQTRIKEAKKASKIVGSKNVFFLGLKDAHLKKEIKNPYVTEKLKYFIKTYKPAKIFTHARDDFFHSDHLAVHRAVIHAVDALQTKVAIYTFNIWTMDIRKNVPKLVVDVTSTFPQKQKALACFSSQKLSIMQLVPKVYSKMVMDGIGRGMRYAEVFLKVR